MGISGTLLKTTNGGATWVGQNSGTTNSLASVHFSSNANTGYAVGSGGLVLTTENGGVTWNNHSSSFTSTEFQSVHFPKDATTGYAVGASDTILKTTNGGISWMIENSGATHYLYSVHFPTRDTGYAVGDYGTILKTENGGSAWAPQVSGTNAVLYSVQFPVDATVGFAVGQDYTNSKGVILRTTNGGNNWERLPPDTILGLNCVDFPVDNVTGFIAAASGILKTTDGGDSWSSQPTITTNLSVYFPRGATTGYVVGFYFYMYYNWGTILKTTDGGNTWSQGWEFGLEALPMSIGFQDEDSGYVGSTWGFFKTTDGGATFSQPTPQPTQINFICFPVRDTGYAVGYSGNILKYTPEPFVGVDEIKTTERTNGQGYLLKSFPNPFTRQTIISYQLPTYGPIRLMVYNISGQVVKVLENEKKPAGIYQATWNGRDDKGRPVPSGIYFLRLVSGAYHTVKKTVLLR